MNMLSTESKAGSLTTASDLPSRLADALRRRRSPRLRRDRTSPELGYGRHAGPAPHTARAAAVVLLLFQRNGQWHLPLTERPLTLAHHAGQVSLPGGAIESGEESAAAALRELDEELGFRTEIDVLGQLPECYVFASDYLVTPWLATTAIEPEWDPHAHEVQTVVELPLSMLLEDQPMGRLTIERGPLVFHAPCIRVGHARIWGATCVILDELANLLRQLLETME
jgi:8-oxo-dGTP pyrophosphatase MutT (NUDIX family)